MSPRPAEGWTVLVYGSECQGGRASGRASGRAGGRAGGGRGVSGLYAGMISGRFDSLDGWPLPKERLPA